jgi:hypothetical protein
MIAYIGKKICMLVLLVGDRRTITMIFHDHILGVLGATPRILPPSVGIAPDASLPLLLCLFVLSSIDVR